MLHWLYKKRDSAQNNLESTKCILIPIYVALLPLYEIFLREVESMTAGVSIVTTIILAGVVVSMSAYILTNKMQKVKFYEDYIEIVEKVYEYPQ